ncbi:MAG: hypothetical protein LBP20_03005 [Treponema sp.]|jgi:hypothetical protein|nr:hypothetical protein [Treponema sp.]
MGLFFPRRIIARFAFIIGLLLMFLGSGFLLGNLAGISRISVLGSFFFVIAGSLCAFLAIKLNKRVLYLFFAAFLLQAGFFLFLSALRILPLPLSKSWPLLSIFCGIALFPSGWRRFGAFRITYVVPSAAFVLLGSGLLIFSLDLVAFSFRQFILNWWPLLIVLAGFVLVLVSFGAKSNTGDSKR